MTTLLIGLGGCIGTLLRYLITSLIQTKFKLSFYPYGTLSVNVLGCLFIGLLMGLVENKGFLSKDLRLFLSIGMLGGFTTFSTFIYESFTLLHDGKFFFMLLNISLQVCLGLIAVFIGYNTSSNLL